MYRCKIFGSSVPMTPRLIKRIRSVPTGSISTAKLQHFITVTTLISTALVSLKEARKFPVKIITTAGQVSECSGNYTRLGINE
jgi:hypothetical protein